MLVLDKITLVKTSNNTGEAYAYFNLDDGQDNVLILNKIMIDMSNGAEPIEIIKYKNVPVFSGKIVDNIKAILIDILNEYFSELELGFYTINSKGIYKG